MRLSFDSIEEVKEFVKNLKGTRGGKDKDDEPAATGSAPAPLAPPAGGFNPSPGAASGFAPGGAAPGGTFPGAAAPVANPAVAAIVAKIDGSIASGQNAEGIATWFRVQLGAEANGATLDQIKAVLLPKAPQATLDGILKLMGG